MSTLILALQTYILWKQKRIFDKQSDIAREQSGIAHRQFLLTGAQTDLLDKQKEIARQTYLRNFAPRIKVRNVVVIGPIFAPGQSLVGYFFVENFGGTSACVLRSHCQFLWNVNGLPMERPYENREPNNSIPIGQRVEANSTIKVNFDSVAHQDYTIYPDGAYPPGNALNRAFFMGWVEFKDEQGLQHKLHFCREFLPGNGSARFYLVKDADYQDEEA